MKWERGRDKNPNAKQPRRQSETKRGAAHKAGAALKYPTVIGDCRSMHSGSPTTVLGYKARDENVRARTAYMLALVTDRVSKL